MAERSGVTLCANAYVENVLTHQTVRASIFDDIHPFDKVLLASSR